MAYPPLALQPYTLRRNYTLDAHGDLVLDRIKALLFDGIEGGSSDPVAWKAKLDARGLRYSATHVSLSGKPDVAKIVSYLRTVDCTDVINSGLTTWNNPTLDDYR